MTVHGSPDSGSDAGADAAVETYLSEIEARLLGPRGWRADVVAELRDGLQLAVEEHRAAGAAQSLAVRLAVEEFGDPTTVASGFVGEAAARQARRVAGRLLATGPVVAAIWGAAFVTSGVPMLRGELAGPWRAMPLIGAVLAIAVPAALLAFTAAGQGVLRFDDHPRLAPAAAATAAACCATGDVVMLAMFGSWLTTAGGLAPAAYALGGFAAAVSVTRLVAATLAARRCAAIGVRIAHPR